MELQKKQEQNYNIAMKSNSPKNFAELPKYLKILLNIVQFFRLKMEHYVMLVVGDRNMNVLVVQ